MDNLFLLNIGGKIWEVMKEHGNKYSEKKIIL